MSEETFPFWMQTGANFSPERRYRYRLWRTWDSTRKHVVFIMLNPSIADANVNDPTVERCERRAMDWGWGGLVVVNLFGLIATYPKDLLRADDPVGPDNDLHITAALVGAGIVVGAWGAHGSYRGRSKAVKAILANSNCRWQHLGLTQSGEPRHPLYIALAVQPVLWGGD